MNLTEFLNNLDVERLLRAAYHAQDSAWVREQFQTYKGLAKSSTHNKHWHLNLFDILTGTDRKGDIAEAGVYRTFDEYLFAQDSVSIVWSLQYLNRRDTAKLIAKVIGESPLPNGERLDTLYTDEDRRVITAIEADTYMRFSDLRTTEDNPNVQVNFVIRALGTFPFEGINKVSTMNVFHDAKLVGYYMIDDEAAKSQWLKSQEVYFKQRLLESPLIEELKAYVLG